MKFPSPHRRGSVFECKHIKKNIIECNKILFSRSNWWELWKTVKNATVRLICAEECMSSIQAVAMIVARDTVSGKNTYAEDLDGLYHNKWWSLYRYVWNVGWKKYCKF